MTPCSTSVDPLGVADPWLKTAALENEFNEPDEMWQNVDKQCHAVQKKDARWKAYSIQFNSILFI